jgi:hypothetical protein
MVIFKSGGEDLAFLLPFPFLFFFARNTSDSYPSFVHMY